MFATRADWQLAQDNWLKQSGMAMDSRSRRRIEAREHNAERDSRKALTLPPIQVEPKPAVDPKRVTPHGYTKPARVTLLIAVCMGLMAKSINNANKFRGYVLKQSSPRAKARAAGYANVREQQAYEALKKREQAVAAQAAT